jgi:asparagine synthase (glutamine-hydrolysing)
MCGIAGFVDESAFAAPQTPRLQRGADAALVRSMCDVIRHRGPDDDGYYVAPGVGLGMRRLSIIDLATGRQPIHNEDRTVWVVFNGEIYNYRDLRAELERHGHRFYTSSDTETIVHAYEQWGEDLFVRLRGMFGIAIWDTRARRLLLGRDRAGIKPLFYCRSGRRLYFGSEVKSLLEAPSVDRSIDAASLDFYLSYLYTPPNQSIFESIVKLPPGHFLSWDSRTLAVQQYWALDPHETFRGSEEDAIRQLRAVLADAVRSHMVSDVPLGAFLSGGVDSSAVVGLMAEASPRPVKTFSIGFDEPRFDELQYARQVARHFGTDHHEFVVRPDACAILDDLIWHLDEPFGDCSAIPTWYVSEIARRHVTVVLSGDGGDELFGGYDRYLPHANVTWFDRLPLPGRRRLASLCWPMLPHGARGKNLLRRAARDDRGRYLDSVTFFHADERRALLSPAQRRALAGTDAEARLSAAWRRLDMLPWPSQMMHFDFETYLPEDILVKIDRMSMAHSIESRVPLLDNEVIDFATTLPAGLKMRDGRGKHIFKRAVASLLPAEILDRPKQGFGVPIGVWFSGGLRDLFGDVLLSPRTAARGYFDRRFLDRIVHEHLSGRRDHTDRLWALLVLELWHRRHVDVRPLRPAEIAV